jgi:hypothetical protein
MSTAPITPRAGASIPDDPGDNAADPVEPQAPAAPPMPQLSLTVERGHQSSFPRGELIVRGGWGKIVAVEVAKREIVFDLYAVEAVVPGVESEGWNFVNDNPLLRTLRLAENAEIRACRSLGKSPPVPCCGNPWLNQWGGFGFWSLADLKRIIGIDGVGLFRVLVDPHTNEVIWIEQWWSP